ncbi:MAG: hypothetical protein ACLTTU_14300 [Bilophila wadsworthia]
MFTLRAAFAGIGILIQPVSHFTETLYGGQNGHPHRHPAGPSPLLSLGLISCASFRNASACSRPVTRSRYGPIATELE